MTEKACAKVKAGVYFQHNGSWVPSQDDGLSDVTLYKNTTTGSWRVKSVSALNPNYMAINSELVGGVSYQRTKAQFHQWKWHGGETYGLSFQNPKEANEFGSAMENAISSINEGTTVANTRLTLPTELNGEKFQCLACALRFCEFSPEQIEALQACGEEVEVLNNALRNGTLTSEQLTVTWALHLFSWLHSGSLPDTVFCSVTYDEQILNLHNEIGSIVYYNHFMGATKTLEDAKKLGQAGAHNTLLIISMRSESLNGAADLSELPPIGEVLISATAGFRILATPRKFSGHGPWENVINMELVVDPFSDSLVCAGCKPLKATKQKLVPAQ